MAVEGSIVSRLFKKPEEKSDYEVFKSFEKELQAAGFEMLTVADDKKSVELLVRDLNGNSKNDRIHRRYTHQGKPASASQVALVATQAQEYIAARKTIDRVASAHAAALRASARPVPPTWPAPSRAYPRRSPSRRRSRARSAFPPRPPSLPRRRGRRTRRGLPRCVHARRAAARTGPAGSTSRAPSAAGRDSSRSGIS